MKLRKIIDVMLRKDVPSPIENLINCNFNARKSFMIAKLARKLSEDYELYQAQMLKIYKKYGVETKDGTFEFKDADAAKANKEIIELLETEIDGYDGKIQIELTDDFKLTPKDMLTLESFIEFTEETEVK